jgi:hypothetical protein
MYFAIIGDIVNSKTLEERKLIQKQLNAILNQINIDFDEIIASKFIITLGDEFQGLLSSSQNIIQIIDQIQFKLFPTALRFGIGIGNIDTEINKNMAIGSDGPAYHFARNMITQIKMQEKGKMYGSTNILFYSKKNRDILSLVNTNLQLCSFLERNWTDKQRQLIKKMVLKEPSQKEAAKDLGIVQSSVQRRLKSAGYYDYIHAKSQIAITINKTWGGRNGE